MIYRKSALLAMAILFNVAAMALMPLNAEAQIFKRSRSTSSTTVTTKQTCVGENCPKTVTTYQYAVPATVVTSKVVTAPVVTTSVASTQSTTQVNAAAQQVRFRKTLIAAAEQSFRDGDIERSDLIKIRIFSLNGQKLQELQQAVAEQAVQEGLAVSVQAIDWDALLAFIKELIPIIIQLIELFG